MNQRRSVSEETATLVGGSVTLPNRVPPHGKAFDEAPLLESGSDHESGRENASALTHVRRKEECDSGEWT